MASSPLGNNNDDFNNENESSKKKQTVCVIGAGISGLSAAYLLHQSNAFAVTVYESEPTAGGHALTREKSKHAGELDVDLGFQVFNLTTYPHLVGLFEELRVKHEQSDMSFSLQSERTEWGSLGLSGIFAQKRNLINPKFWNMIREILKFKKVKHDVLSGSKKEYWETKTLGEYLRENGYSDYFRDHYVLPMCAAIWSCNDKDALGFPLKPLITFWANHHLLEIFERPVWRVVKGRSKAYVKAVLKALPDGCVKTGRYVHTVHRYFDDASKSRIKVKTTETKKAATGEQTKEKFDHVIFACHAHQALAMIGKNATEKELEILSNFRTTRNEVVLHDDPQFMPKNRSAWASWNCKSIGKKGENDSVCVTYWVNLLQNLPKGAKDVFVTLNPTEKIDEERVEFKKYLGHPVFNENAIKAQEDLKSRLQGENNTWFTGAWLRYGFHEDGIHSAVEMCKKLLGKDDVVPWMPRFDVEPKQSLLGSAFMSMFQTIAGKWMPPNAKLTFTLPTGVDFSISGKRDKSKPVPDEVRLTIFSEDMFKQCITRQDIGLGEAYMNNDFSGDVMAFLDLICSGHPSKQEKSNRKKGLSNPKKNWFNPKELVAAILSILGGAAEMAAHKALSNTKEGSKKNIEYHYDAGNAFYSLFLDNTLLYSSAVHVKNADGTPAELNGDDNMYIDKLLMNGNREMTFEEKEIHLEQSQYDKIDAMIARLDFKKTDEVLEIGCGWGQLAIRLATKIGCKVTGLTLSKEQAAEARARVAKLKLSHLIEIKIQDYRDETNVYDKVISIEMLEAVGHEHLPTFFETVRNCLKPNGTCAIQVITIPDERYKQYCETTSDFIRAYIFPGGHLPSISAMKNAAPNGLSLDSYDDIGLHYAVTLRLWRERMLARKQKVFDLGYSKRFVRMYEFYFAYCEAAFKHGLIGDLQMTWKRDGYDLDALKARDEEDKLKSNEAEFSWAVFASLLFLLFLLFAVSILLSTERAKEKYTALILPLLQRKGAIIDNPFATIIIAFVATLVFRFMLLRRNIANAREEAKKLAKDRLATMQREGGGRLGDGYAAA